MSFPARCLGRGCCLRFGSYPADSTPATSQRPIALPRRCGYRTVCCIWTCRWPAGMTNSRPGGCPCCRKRSWCRFGHTAHGAELRAQRCAAALTVPLSEVNGIGRAGPRLSNRCLAWWRYRTAAWGHRPRAVNARRPVTSGIPGWGDGRRHSARQRRDTPAAQPCHSGRRPAARSRSGCMKIRCGPVPAASADAANRPQVGRFRRHLRYRGSVPYWVTGCPGGRGRHLW